MLGLEIKMNVVTENGNVKELMKIIKGTEKQIIKKFEKILNLNNTKNNKRKYKMSEISLFNTSSYETLGNVVL